MSDKIWLRGYELWCFQGRGVRGSIDTLYTLAEILSQTVSEPVLKPVLKSILEPVLKSVRGELG